MKTMRIISIIIIIVVSFSGYSQTTVHSPYVKNGNTFSIDIPKGLFLASGDDFFADWSHYTRDSLITVNEINDVQAIDRIIITYLPYSYMGIDQYLEGVTEKDAIKTNPDTSVIYRLELLDDNFEAAAMLFFDEEKRESIISQSNVTFKFGDYNITIFCFKFSKNETFVPAKIINEMLNSIVIYNTERESSLKQESESSEFDEFMKQ